MISPAGCFAAALRKAGCVVLEAEGSSEAMALYAAAQEPIQVLFTDIFLPPPEFQLSSGTTRYPRVNGPELVRQALALGHELRVLFMSSQPLSHLHEHGMRIDADRFLEKPFSATALCDRLSAVLASLPLRLETEPLSRASIDVQWVD
jgi:CheY-like chemotaxis protein